MDKCDWCGKPSLRVIAGGGTTLYVCKEHVEDATKTVQRAIIKAEVGRRG